MKRFYLIRTYDAISSALLGDCADLSGPYLTDATVVDAAADIDATSGDDVQSILVLTIDDDKVSLAPYAGQELT